MSIEERLIAEIGGVRLDQFLARRLTGYSRSHLKDLVERGMVTVDGSVRRPDFRISAGAVIRLKLAAPGWPSHPLEDWILHEDDALLVLAKPAGVVTHPIGESWERTPEAALHEPEANLAGLLIKHRPGLLSAGVSRCGIVHRLDRQTSGVLVVAKTAQAQEALLAGFR
jgi:23S rRNA pseudouridine1911/1915/1917 synthase